LPGEGEPPMDIDAGIIDQRVRKLAETHRAELVRRGKDSEERARSNAFCLLCVRTLLDLEESDALDCLTDGFRDAGIDAVHIGDVIDGEFTATLFQAKYGAKSASFETGDVLKSLDTLSTVFDPDVPLVHADDIIAKVEEIRSMIRDGILPRVRMVLCNNGPHWDADAQNRIAQSGLAGNDQIVIEHLDHHRLVDLLKPRIDVAETLAFDGAALFDDFAFRRVAIGKVPVTQIRDLMDRNDDRLLDRNIRRWLGVTNRVNQEIQATLSDLAKRPDFYFYNNGITMICSNFTHNKLQSGNHQVRVKGLQIINGGQTCKTIQTALRGAGEADFGDTYVLVRLYQIDESDRALVDSITLATNSQTPIELRDLRANDPVQTKLAEDVGLLGYEYKTKRDDVPTGPDVITSPVAAEAVLSVWKRCPHQAKFSRAKLFGDLYRRIFDHLNGARLVLAVLVFREIENRRKRSAATTPFAWFIPYASHHLATVIGDRILAETVRKESAVDHTNFEALRTLWKDRTDEFYNGACDRVRDALEMLGIRENDSLQRVAAQFRRGDLMAFLTPAAAASK